MILLTGLGNPGPTYHLTRHNAGFMLTERIRQAYGFPAWKTQSKGLVSRGKLGGLDLVLLQPQTFMNLSGPCVQAISAFFKLPPAQVWVAHDELDVPLGRVKYKLGGGDAGHNGLRSITASLGTPAYHRLRLGIDRPAHKSAVERYVLQPFEAHEALRFAEVTEALTSHLPDVLADPVGTLAKLGNAAA